MYVYIKIKNVQWVKKNNHFLLNRGIGGGLG